MSNRLHKTEDQAVQRTLHSSYCPEVIREARERQDALLVERFQGHPYKIADEVISHFYRAMTIGGLMFLTVYKDVPEAEAAQIDFYEHTGQHVITPRGSRFVATAERFWSVRWSKKSMLSNLSACTIKESDVVFNDLNAIAWLVEIKK